MKSLGWDVNETAETAPFPRPEIIFVSMEPMTTEMMLSMTAGTPMAAMRFSFADVLVGCAEDSILWPHLSLSLFC